MNIYVRMCAKSTSIVLGCFPKIKNNARLETWGRCNTSFVLKYKQKLINESECI